MNGIYNAIFILLLMFMLVAVDYVYSISDKVINGIYTVIPKNNITDNGYLSYQNIRAIMYGGITGVLVPFLIFLSFMSSFFNNYRQAGIEVYLIGNLICIIATPIMIYLFAQIVTQLLNVSILDSAYMASVFFNNFLYIMVANMLLSLASFVFITKKPIGVM